jgi:hypothetical protein
VKFLLPSSQALTNIQLNALEVWRHRRCSRCGRSYPQTLLNVRLVIERGDSLQCINRRSCDDFLKEVGQP